MKISELIERLEQLRRDHGDIEIVDANDKPFRKFTIVNESGRFECEESVA